MQKLFYSKIVVAVLVLAAVAVPVDAQQPEEQIDATGQGLEVSPPVIELDADPGERVVTEVNVRNITEIDVRASGTVEDFVARDETGEPRILLDTEEESPYPLAAYVEDVPDLTIEPAEQETAEIVINVPEDASPGGHFGVVRFSGEPADPTREESAVAISASIGSLILLNVSGDIEEDLAVEELAVAQDGEQGQLFQTGPFDFITRLENRGNVYLQPQGELRITNLIGQEVATIPFNVDEGEEFNLANVLPDQVRRFEEHYDDKPFWFGRYTLTVDLEYGEDNQEVTASTDFWVIPYVMVGVILLMLIAVGFFGRKALKAYKQNVIKKYQQQNRQQ